MKFRFDLLPDDYRSLPRDYFGIVLAILLVIGTIYAVRNMNIENRNELEKIQKEIYSVENDLREIISQAESIQPPLREINSLRDQINFINKNLDTTGTSLVKFLADLEATVPQNIIIRDFSPKRFDTQTEQFTLTGEAPSVFTVTEFIRRMNSSGSFRAHLRNTQNISANNKTLTRFNLDFTYIKND